MKNYNVVCLLCPFPLVGAHFAGWEMGHKTTSSSSVLSPTDFRVMSLVPSINLWLFLVTSLAFYTSLLRVTHSKEGRDSLGCIWLEAFFFWWSVRLEQNSQIFNEKYQQFDHFIEQLFLLLSLGVSCLNTSSLMVLTHYCPIGDVFYNSFGLGFFLPTLVYECNFIHQWNCHLNKKRKKGRKKTNETCVAEW